MDYDGRYNAFDLDRVKTYPLNTRSNKVALDDLVRPEDVDDIALELPGKTCDEIEHIARAIVSCRQAGRPVVIFTGAHLIKLRPFTISSWHLSARPAKMFPMP